MSVSVVSESTTITVSVSVFVSVSVSVSVSESVSRSYSATIFMSMWQEISSYTAVLPKYVSYTSESYSPEKSHFQRIEYVVSELAAMEPASVTSANSEM